MKKLFTLIVATLMSTSLFAAPILVPTVQDVVTAGFDTNNARVIVLYFDEQVCNDIVWGGSYNEWATNPEIMSHFEPLENYPDWYVLELWDESNVVQGKPVQLKTDGTFSWDFQSGDVNAWINMAQPGTKTATIAPGYSGEADCTWPDKGVYIYEVAYFKNHNTPCGAPVEYKYTTYSNWQIKYGPNWVWSDNMTKVKDGLFSLKITWPGSKDFSGINVSSDDNPIKQDWFALDDPNVVVGEEIGKGDLVDIMLVVVDDETIRLGVGVNPGPGPTSIVPTLLNEDVNVNKFIHNKQLIIRKGGKKFNVAGVEIK